MNNGWHVSNLACVQFHPRIKNMHTEAQVTTTSAQVYLRKLCRHFAHKVPATLTGDQGIIEFPFGRCRIDTRPEQIGFSIDVAQPGQLATAEQVVTDHLLRMARGDDLFLHWVRSEP